MLTDSDQICRCPCHSKLTIPHACAGDETGEMQPGDRGDGPALPVDKVYSVAAGNKLTSLMNEYRRRKQAHSATAAAPKVAARSTTRKASLKAAEDDIGVSKEQLQEERKASIVKVMLSLLPQLTQFSLLFYSSSVWTTVESIVRKFLV